jgi:hypothetical protein
MSLPSLENGDETGSGRKKRQCLGMNDTREALLVVTDEVGVIIQGEQNIQAVEDPRRIEGT